MNKLTETLKLLAQQDPKLCVKRDEMDKTFGHNPLYLLDTYGLTKSDLIRLERLGLATKARYEVRHPKANLWDKLDEKINEHNAKVSDENARLPLVPRVCGTHRTRWILFLPEEV